MNSLEKDLVPYEPSLALKELGFDEPCFVKVWWLNSINRHTKEPYKPRITMNGQDIKFEYPTPEKYPSTEFDILELQVPTFSQAFRWFREKHNLKDKYGVFPHHTIMFNYIIGGGKEEEAELACLDKLIELAKKK